MTTPITTEEIMEMVKMISLTLAVWFAFVNLVKACHRSRISSVNIFIMSVSIAGFCYAIGAF